LGDTAGVFYNQFRLAHTYPAANIYKGFLSMVDVNGCQTKAVPFNIEIWALPVANFEHDNIRCEKTDIAFRDISTTNNGTISSLVWNFGEPSSGVRNTSTLPAPTHNFATANTFNVSLTAQCSNGCRSTSVSKTVVINPKPLARFILPDTVCLPNAAQFRDASTIADGSQASFTYNWNFGDLGGAGNVLTGSGLTNVSHVYPSSANYVVRLIVTSKDGCIDDTVRTLTSSSLRNQPIAQYIVNTPSQDTPRICFGDSILFRDNSLNVRKSYWIWGNGNVDSVLNPAAQFGLSLPGLYYGTHYIVDNFGCRSANRFFTTIISDVPEVVGKTVYVRPNTPILLTPSYKNATFYEWQLVKPANSASSFLNFDDINYPTCVTSKDLTYLITAFNDACASIPDSFKVKILEVPVIPTAFSPNGDGINDIWDLGSLVNYTGASVQVYDRFGKIVFNRPVFSQSWNGRIQNSGADCPTGVYYYIINPGSGVPVMSGYVTILR
jgi:gliding motility-associated-like protein